MTVSIAALAAEAAEEAPLALITAAPRCCTVGIKSVSNQSVSAITSAEVIADTDWFDTDFIPTVQQRGAAVIKARGASSAASAANAAIETVKRIHHPGSKDWFSVALVSEGQYGVDQDLVFSYPCINEGGQIKVVEGLQQL